MRTQTTRFIERKVSRSIPITLLGSLQRLKSSGRKRQMISRAKRREYIKAGGSFCINCGGGNISAGRVESEGREAWQPVQCYDCYSKWNDIFRLIGVGDIVLPEDEPMIPEVFGNMESADGQTETA